MARTGRRPGRTDTRVQILASARRQFAASGYSGATIRGIAADAEVDPALVHHYFGTKHDLFVASLQLPVDPAAVAGEIVEGDPDEIGARLLRTLLRVWSTEPGQTMLQAVLRSTLTDDDLLAVLREFMLETVLLPITRRFAPDRVELRASLVASQVLGLAVLRYVTRIEPLASADDDAVVTAVAPTVQRYLTGPLTD